MLYNHLTDDNPTMNHHHNKSEQHTNMGIQLQHREELLHRIVKDVLESQIRLRSSRSQPLRQVSSDLR